MSTVGYIHYTLMPMYNLYSIDTHIKTYYDLVLYKYIMIGLSIDDKSPTECRLISL